jgi:hypothetical protein
MTRISQIPHKKNTERMCGWGPRVTQVSEWSLISLVAFKEQNANIAPDDFRTSLRITLVDKRDSRSGGAEKQNERRQNREEKGTLIVTQHHS